MKYIDAEKLKRLVGELKGRAKRNRCDSWGIVPDALEEVEGFIDSLQQEQPEVDLEKLALEKYPETMTYDSRGLYDRKKYDRDIYKQGLKDGYNLKHKIRNDNNNL